MNFTCSYCSKKYQLNHVSVPVDENGILLMEIGVTPITGGDSKNLSPRTQKMYKCSSCGYSTRMLRGKVGIETISPEKDPLIGFGRETIMPQILNS